jgi:acyl-coenzyme A thioesterase PaaI-like protein
MWLAIMTLLGKDAMTVTTELKTTFLKSAKREDVKCTAKILTLGKV